MRREGFRSIGLLIGLVLLSFIFVGATFAGAPKISAGDSHTLCIQADGSLWGWGWNRYGQLGDGTTTDKTSPVQIGTEKTWVAIVASNIHSLGLKADGTLWGWGGNFDGQLGDGTYKSESSPTQVGMDNTWVGIAAGYNHSLAKKSDGSLWVWGSNEFGQLGDGTNNPANSPVQIPGNSWRSIGSGYRHNLGIRSDGTLWAWGRNNMGQLGLGDGDIVDRNSPVQVGSDTKWVAIDGGAAHSLGLQSDGTLWAWGWNIVGEVGDGTYTE